jgi:hypothetical protein
MNFKSNNIIFTTALVVIAAISCHNQASKKDNSKTDSTDAQKKEAAVAPFADNNFNRAARYIAGMNQLSENEYSAWEKKPEWIAYKSQMDSAWDKMQSSRFTVMTNFYEENFSSYRKSEDNVYYPFSGPDWVNIYLAYPNGSSYTMAGLEPVGNIPNPLALTKPSELKNALTSFSKGFRTLKEWGYYVTSWMGRDLNTAKLNGVIPIDYLFMIRMGCSIDNVEFLSLDENGKANVVSNLPADKINMKGVRITFRHANKKQSVMNYFTGNLADADSPDYGHSYIKNYESYVKANVKNANSYLKASSYLLYNATFSKSLYLLLDCSKTILTDESGVPYDIIDRSKWDITLFGKYFKPTKDFTWIKQPALKADYTAASATIKPIPFFTGYHRILGESNLQFYVKK